MVVALEFWLTLLICYLGFFSIVSLIIDIALLWRFRNSIGGWIKRKRNPQNYCKILMIKPNMQIAEEHVTLDDKFSFMFNNGLYTVNPRLLLWQKSRPVQVFPEGCPFPIDFNDVHQPNAKRLEALPNAENYKLAMKNKIIKDLLAENKLLIIILVAIIITGMIALAIALKVYGLLEKKEAPPAK